MTRRQLFALALSGLAFWRVRKPKYEPPSMVITKIDHSTRTVTIGQVNEVELIGNVPIEFHLSEQSRFPWK